MGLYRTCEEARFGKTEVPRELRDQALKTLRQTISRIERVRP